MPNCFLIFVKQVKKLKITKELMNNKILLGKDNFLREFHHIFSTKGPRNRRLLTDFADLAIELIVGSLGFSAFWWCGSMGFSCNFSIFLLISFP